MITRFPLELEDIQPGEYFCMYMYEGIFQRVILPESYELGLNRKPLRAELAFSAEFKTEPYIIEIHKEHGDGVSIPILNVGTGKVLFMAKTKPVRRTAAFICLGVDLTGTGVNFTKNEINL